MGRTDRDVSDADGGGSAGNVTSMTVFTGRALASEPVSVIRHSGIGTLVPRQLVEFPGHEMVDCSGMRNSSPAASGQLPW